MYFKKWNEFVLTEDNIVNNTSTTNTQGTNATNNIKPNTNIPNKKQAPIAGTNGVTYDKMSDDELQKHFNNWNSKFSQEFKFENNMPKQVKNENTLDELLANISPEYKPKVREGIEEMIKFLQIDKISKSLNGKELLVVGYTSTTASESYNQALSSRRAKIVINAIKNALKASKVNVNINFIEKGEGKNPDGLIVINDQTLEPLQLGKGAPELSDEQKNILTKSKEERQKINRRVKITLPQYLNVNTPIKTEIKADDNTPETVNKPELPKPEDIKFNLNSFILTKESQSILTTLCTSITKWNLDNKEDDRKIKNVYISAHTKLGKGDDQNETEDRKIQKNMLAILSSNRGQYVKDFIRAKIGEENSKLINFTVYPVAYLMGEEKKVVITFEKGEHMLKAEEVFKQLSETYQLPVKNNSLDNLGTFIDNTPLLKILDKNIKASMKDGDNDKYVPLELWYDTLDGYQGFEKYKNFRETFKSKFNKIIEWGNKKYGREYNLEDFVYNPE